MTWILIITLWVGQSQGGVSVHSVEFTSKESCMSAGNAYLNQMKDVYPTARTLCVPKDYVNPNAYKPKYIKDGK